MIRIMLKWEHEKIRKGKMEMYTYEEFKKEMMSQLRERAGSDVKVYTMTFNKMNEGEKEGIFVQKKDHNVLPYIALEELYQLYQDGKQLSWCARKVLEAAEKEKRVLPTEFLHTWEEAKEQIHICLIKKAWNEKILERMPYKDVLDLAAICRYTISETEHGIVGCNITYEMLKLWRIEEKELWKAAEENLQRDEYPIEDIMDAIRGDLAIEDKEEWYGIQYVMTNKRKSYGASAMLRTDLLSAFAKEKGCSFYIIPSSLHEIILMPDTGRYCKEKIAEMVKEVNEYQVQREEWLSENVYYFRQETGEVECLG